MEFDKSRVYTALNADELKVGSKCIFADDLGELKRLVSIEDTPQVLIKIKKESYKYRFERVEADNMGDTLFALAYLIEPPDAPKYKPFKSVEQAMEAIQKHGGWVERKNFGTRYILIAKEKHIGLFKQEDGWCTSNDLFQDFVFVDDGSPCGELVVE